MSRAPGCTGPAEGFDRPKTRTELEQETGRRAVERRVQPPSRVVRIAERAQEVVEVTELEPYDTTFIGKRINADDSLTEYPRVTWWRQGVAHVPATIDGMPDLAHWLLDHSDGKPSAVPGLSAGPVGPFGQASRFGVRAGCLGSDGGQFGRLGVGEMEKIAP
jgi:hypothetical protein